MSIRNGSSLIKSMKTLAQSPLSLAAIVLGFSLCVATVSAEKIRTVIPQSSLNYLSVYIAESKGFFQQEGFEHEILVLAGPVGAAALLGGSVDFGGGGGSAMRAAAGGAPLKGIFFQTDKVTAYLVTDPSISRAVDLKGKKVGIGGIGSSQDTPVDDVYRTGGPCGQRNHPDRLRCGCQPAYFGD